MSRMSDLDIDRQEGERIMPVPVEPPTEYSATWQVTSEEYRTFVDLVKRGGISHPTRPGRVARSITATPIGWHKDHGFSHRLVKVYFGDADESGPRDA